MTISSFKSGPGICTYKHRVRAIFRIVAFLSLLVVMIILNACFNDDQVESYGNQYSSHRRLDGNDTNEKILLQWSSLWNILPYIAGVLYMFVALAIVCDEYFVPALEVISGEYHLNLTPDIAGATLMAAGGSAPELFTNFIGTFQESEVGFGAIVGSAVFNILFVIGMCSLLSKDVLHLSWWPLLRDTTCYAIGLLVLAIFVGAKGAGQIDLFEAITLFTLYLVYIGIMSKNEQLYAYFKGKKTLDGDKYTKIIDEIKTYIGDMEEKPGTAISDEEAHTIMEHIGLNGYEQVRIFRYCKTFIM
jgi:hypothetical protein